MVDDQPTSRIILETVLRGIGADVQVTGYTKPQDALRDLKSGRTPDLIVADYCMPGLDGITFTRRIRGIPACRDIPLVIITVVEQRKVMYEALEAGATDFLVKPVDHYECRVRCRNLLTLRRQQSILRSRSQAMESVRNRAAVELRGRERDALSMLALACAARVRPARDTRRVGTCARGIALDMGFAPEFCSAIELAAPLHDIGMLCIPDAILFKQGPLTPEETLFLQAHTRIGYDMLRHGTSPVLTMAASIALHHHEAFDGSGFPQGLSGDEIPVEARIVAVANMIDAMCDDDGRPGAAAAGVLNGMGGRTLDPACVDAWLSHISDPVSAAPSIPLVCEP